MKFYQSPEYKHQWYLAHIKECKQRAYRYQIFSRKRNFALINKIKREQGCKDCGLRDPRCLDFDHRPGTIKRNTVTALANMGLSEKALMTEINKCEVRCANCHRIITYIRRHQEQKYHATNSCN